METYACYADGKWLEPAGGEYFDSENPYTDEVRTEDHRPALNLANRLEAGRVYLNNYFDACTQAPVDGRENGCESMRDFLHPKSTWPSTAPRISAAF